MEKAQVFDLMEFPLAPAPDGGVVVYRDRRTVGYVPLRGTPFQVMDAARDQGSLPWLLSRQELFMLGDEGRRELAFELSPFGAPVAGGDLYPSLVELERGPAERMFVLNTMQGARVLRLIGHELIALESTALPYLGVCSWEQGGQIRFGGMSARTRAAGGAGTGSQWHPGRPAVLSVREANRSEPASYALEPVPVPVHWADSAKAHSLTTREIEQLTPECCIAGALNDGKGVLLCGVLALPSGENPLDELVSRPMNVEYLGYLVLSLEGSRVLDCRIFRCILATLRCGSSTWAYISDNKGDGGTVGSLTRLELDASGVRSERPLVLHGVDPSSTCTSFQPRMHPKVGFFGSAQLRSGDSKPVAHYLQSDDALSWTVIGRAGEIATILAP